MCDKHTSRVEPFWSDLNLILSSWIVAACKASGTLAMPKGVAMLSTWIDTLFGCSHKRITFPITIRQKRARTTTPTGTYVVCLDCGGEFEYDWKEMKVLGRRENEVSIPAKAIPAKAA